MLSEKCAINLDLTSSAQAYATFSAVLAGFAFSGLCLYIARSPISDKESEEAGSKKRRARQVADGSKHSVGRGEEHDPIEVRHVSAAVFYAMASLGISSFLYSNLVSIVKSSQGAAVTALLSYGIIFALSVLSLFYAVTLMMLEHRLTMKAAKHAYWMTIIAGTVIVLRFLAGSAADAVQVRYLVRGTCPPPLPGLFSLRGIFCTLIIAALLSVLSTIELHRREPVEEKAKRTNFPMAPPIVVFITAVFVATVESPYLNTRDSSYAPSSVMIDASYAISVVLITLFVFACGRVVGPRALVDADRSRGRGVQRIVQKFKLVTIMYLALTVFGVLLFFSGPQWYLALLVTLPAIAVLCFVFWLRGPR
jgi:hypothetical protein